MDDITKRVEDWFQTMYDSILAGESPVQQVITLLEAGVPTVIKALKRDDDGKVILVDGVAVEKPTDIKGSWHGFESSAEVAQTLLELWYAFLATRSLNFGGNKRLRAEAERELRSTFASAAGIVARRHKIKSSKSTDITSFTLDLGDLDKDTVVNQLFRYPRSFMKDEVIPGLLARYEEQEASEKADKAEAAKKEPAVA